jgi:two-component system, sporulation sensor kinase E
MSIQLEINDIPNLIIDAAEIRQLILNLAWNGIEAMAPGGVLTIRTFQEQERVTLAVQDQGSGISPENYANVGTPFFTTKPNGTGLGLAVCYSIAQRHKARIEFESGSQGTTFLVHFGLDNLNTK